MSFFQNDIADKLLNSFNSTKKNSLLDLGGDQDEQDRIILNASKSVEPIELRVDYSNFKNHIFFQSAYTAVNLAYSRILNDFPIDGTYRDYFEWRRINNGYENWFFDNFPRQQGYVNFNSASNQSVLLTDYENKINISPTGSFTVEFILKPYETIASAIAPIFSVTDTSQVVSVNSYLESKSGSKYLTLDIKSGSTHSFLSLSVDTTISSSNHYAFVFQNGFTSSNSITTVFLNGIASGSASVAASTFGSFSIQQPNLTLGYYLSGGTNPSFYSGCIDEFRLWTADRTNFIRKNYFKPIFANPSGSLKVYYRFNETTSYGNRIIDYSGNHLHAAFSGAYSLTTTRNSGTLGSWFLDDGDVILDSANSGTVSFVTTQQNSGSIFDSSNRNYIFNIVPAFFTENDGSDNQKLFLLLLARHYDKLKLYIEHLANIHNIALDSSNDTPDRLLNLVAENYGIDVGDVYSSSDPLALYFGEGVFASGAVDSSISVIKNQLKRNILNNLIYLLKTKSTRNSLESVFRSLGISTETININEYSFFSGGIETYYTPFNSEVNVANFNTSSNVNVFISATAASTNNSNIYTQQIRFLLSSGSVGTTSSVISWDSSGLHNGITVRRQNATSISGAIYLTFLDSGSVYRNISSSLLPLYNNQWNQLSYNIILSGNNTPSVLSSSMGFFISQLDQTNLINSQSVFTQSTAAKLFAIPSIYLGTSGTNYFSGFMHEYRMWGGTNYAISSSLDLVKRWHLDYKSTELSNFNSDINNSTATNFLAIRYKLNDFTASTVSNNGPIHDFVNGDNITISGTYTNFTTSSYYNFPGQFVPEAAQSYSYDINTNNNKTRIRPEGRKLNPSEQTIDSPFVTADISPINSLNKEIIRWLGPLQTFNNIIGQPYNKYRFAVKAFNQYKNSYFNNKINTKIDYTVYINMIKWLDSNFATLLNQLIPLDMISSVANFVVEPSVFDYDKFQYSFPYRVNKSPTTITSSISTRPRMSASTFITVGVGDPGRFGHAASASAKYPTSLNFNVTASLSASSGVNFRNFAQRSIQYLSMSNNYNNAGISGSASNPFNSRIISSSNYLRDVLNVNTDYYVSGSNTLVKNIAYNFTGTFRTNPQPAFTGTLNAVQDQRWQWFNSNTVAKVEWDFGIGYGGGWGQSYGRSLKSTSFVQNSTLDDGWIEAQTVINIPSPKFVTYTSAEKTGRKTAIIWPDDNSYNGVPIYFSGSSAGNTASSTGSFASGAPAATLGGIIEVGGYKSITLNILANYSNITNKGGGGAFQPDLTYLVQFQFFENESAEMGFESIISSSIVAGSSVTTKNLPHIYSIPASFDSTIAGGLSTKASLATLTRPIPATRFMRVRITVCMPTQYDGTQGQFNVLAKGILFTDDVSFTDIYKGRER